MQIILETERLRLRRFEPEDAPLLYEHHLAPELRYWIPNESYRTPEEARDAAGFYNAHAEQGVLPYVLAVECKETGELIGDVGLNAVEKPPRPDPIAENPAGVVSQVEVGYSICTEHSGKGYATEALAAMTALARERFGVRTLYGRVLRGNRVSVRVLEKCGYRFLREEIGTADDVYGDGVMVFYKHLEE